MQLLPPTLDGRSWLAHGPRTPRLSVPLPNCAVNVDLAFIFFAQVSSAHLKERAAFPARVQQGAEGEVIKVE